MDRRANSGADTLERSFASGTGGLKGPLVPFYLLMLAPFLGLFLLAASGRQGLIQLVWSPALTTTAHDTFLLLAGTGVLAAIIGVGTAWLIAMSRFPGRSMLAVVLVLPLALPTYLAAYIGVEILDYFGPVQRLIRWAFGFTNAREYHFPDIRSLPGAILVLSLVLYPYVYLPARLMFEKQGGSIIEAARIHGYRGFRLFFRIGLPLARPAIAGGVALVMLETLNDIGATEHFGVQSISLAIRSVWLNRGNLPGAAQLALITLVLVAAILAIEYISRRHRVFSGPQRLSAPARPVSLSRHQAIAAFAACALPAILGFVVPALFLLSEVILSTQKAGLPGDLATSLITSLGLAAAASIAVVVGGLAVGLAWRLLPSAPARFAPRLGTLGYAIPGTVLVIALLPILGGLDELIARTGFSFLLSGTLTAIVIAYVIRFSAIGLSQTEAGLARLSVNIDHAARMLGRSRTTVGYSVLAPNLTRAMAFAAILTFVDAMKELPATLLLRPLNTETLATSLYAKASAGAFEAGASEALLLLLFGLFPVILLARTRQ